MVASGKLHSTYILHYADRAFYRNSSKTQPLLSSPLVPTTVLDIQSFEFS